MSRLLCCVSPVLPCAPNAHAASLSLHILDRSGKAVPGAVVHAEPETAAAPARPGMARHPVYSKTCKH